MALSLATVGGKITAAFINAIVGQVNKTGVTQSVPASYGSVGGSASTVNNRINFTTSTGITLDGAFTSQFNTYKIFLEEFSTGGTAHTVSMKFRVAGADIGTGVYTQQQTVKNGASIVGSAINGAGGWTVCAVSSNTQKTVEITLFKTTVNGYPKQILSHALEAGTTAAATDVEGFAAYNNLVDGFRFDFSAGTSSGNVDVYGYNA